jgi:hypothetical protein
MVQFPMKRHRLKALFFRQENLQALYAGQGSLQRNLNYYELRPK